MASTGKRLETTWILEDSRRAPQRLLWNCTRTRSPTKHLLPLPSQIVQTSAPTPPTPPRPRTREYTRAAVRRQEAPGTEISLLSPAPSSDRAIVCKAGAVGYFFFLKGLIHVELFLVVPSTSHVSSGRSASATRCTTRGRHDRCKARQEGEDEAETKGRRGQEEKRNRPLRMHHSHTPDTPALTPSIPPPLTHSLTHSLTETEGGRERARKRETERERERETSRAARDDMRTVGSRARTRRIVSQHTPPCLTLRTSSPSLMEHMLRSEPSSGKLQLCVAKIRHKRVGFGNWGSGNTLSSEPSSGKVQRRRGETCLARST